MRIHLQAFINKRRTTANRYGTGKTQEQSSEQTGCNPGAKQREIIQIHGNSPGRGQPPDPLQDLYSFLTPFPPAGTRC